MVNTKKRIGKALVIVAFSMILGTTTVSVPAPVQAKTSYVYVTPTGKKYHSTKKCKGLNRAKKVSKVKESKAKDSGLKKCKICW